jgi:hypothetical protein
MMNERSKYCPFQSTKTSCNSFCEWYNPTANKCSVIVLVDKADMFLNMLLTYLSNQFQIKAAVDRIKKEDG